MIRNIIFEIGKCNFVCGNKSGRSGNFSGWVVWLFGNQENSLRLEKLTIYTPPVSTDDRGYGLYQLGLF